MDDEPIFIVGRRGSQDLRQPDYLALNPSAVVPTLIDGDAVITQTIAIIEYFEERVPEPALLPEDAIGRARVRAMSQVIVSDTYPLTTARVMDYLDNSLGFREKAQRDCQHQWNERGFGVIERMLVEGENLGPYC